MITENLSTLKIHKLTQSQYNRELEAGNLDESALYLTPDEAVTLNDLGVTATSAELNYMDGVTSNVQTQLNGKAASLHNHDASNITSGTISIAHGGTEATTAEDARINLGFTYGAEEPTGTPNTGDGSVYFYTGGDAVIEVGTSGIWTYRKWASGIAECWGNYLFEDVTCTKAWGEIFATEYLELSEYPFTFSQIPTQTVHIIGTDSNTVYVLRGAYGSSGPSTTGAGTISFIRGASSDTPTDITVSIQVIGRWK